MKDRGQAIQEYIIPVAVISVLCLAMLTGLGQTLHGKLSESLRLGNEDPVESPPPLDSPPAPAERSVAGTPGTTTRQGAGIGGVVEPPRQGEVQLCFRQGFCINAPDIAEGTVTETTGGLGGDLVHRYSRVLEQIRDQLTAMNADPALINKITRLSERGHQMGDGVHEIARACGSEPPKYNGLVHYCTPSEHITGQLESDRGNFYQLYLEIRALLKQNRSLYPEELDAIIAFESKQIMQVSGDSLGKTVNSEATGPKNGIIIQRGAPIIRQSANNICASGGDTSRCLRDES